MNEDLSRLEAYLGRIETTGQKTREELIDFRAATATKLESIENGSARVEVKVNGNTNRINCIERKVNGVSLKVDEEIKSKELNTRIKVAWIGASGAVGAAVGASLTHLLGG